MTAGMARQKQDEGVDLRALVSAARDGRRAMVGARSGSVENDARYLRQDERHESR